MPCGVTAEHPGTAGEHHVRTANYFHMQQYVNMFFKGMWHSHWVGYSVSFVVSLASLAPVVPLYPQHVLHKPVGIVRIKYLRL